uniref:Uncharacterized protein n=1 Tax=Anguilla anguilla TaxID=7936 RepID=A0A0E9XEJ1_ANGAN
MNSVYKSSALLKLLLLNSI